MHRFWNKTRYQIVWTTQKNVTIFLMSVLTSTGNWTLLFNKYTVIFIVTFTCFANTMSCNAQFLEIEKSFHSSCLWIPLPLKREKNMHMQYKSACIQENFHFLIEKMQDYRITDWVRLEGTTEGHLLQPPSSNRVILEPIAWDCVQMVLKYLHGGRVHSFQSNPFQCSVTHTVKFFLIFRLLRLKKFEFTCWTEIY